MKVCTCFLLFELFAYTNSISRIRPRRDRRDVYLPQDTVKEYSNAKYSGYSSNVHNFRTKDTTVIYQSTPWEKVVSPDRTEKIEMLRAHDTDDTKLNISNSSHNTESGLTFESKHEPKARKNFDKQRKKGKAEDSRSASKQKNVEIISQYEAVIDVQLANSELLKSLRMFEPAKLDMRYDTTLYSKSAIQTEPVPTKSTKRARSIRTQAEIRSQKPTAYTKPPLKCSKRNRPSYRKQLSGFTTNMAPPLPNKGKNQNQKFLRRFYNDTIGAEDFNTYVIRRINAMEKKINVLKEMNDSGFRSRTNDNTTYGVEARKSVTEKFEVKDTFGIKRKDMKGNVIETLWNEHHNFNNEKVNDGHDFPLKNIIINTEPSTKNKKSWKLNIIKKEAVNTTIIDNKNTPQVTNNISRINVNVTKKIKKGLINNNDTTSTISLVKVTNATKLESVVTTLAVGITRRTMAYLEPSYYDSQHPSPPTVSNDQFDSFLSHINDGIDLRM